MYRPHLTVWGDHPDRDPREQTPPRSRHPPEQTPPRGTLPWEQTPPGADTPLEQTPLAADILREQTPPPTPRDTATAVDGTHPIGMHACSVSDQFHFIVL